MHTRYLASKMIELLPERFEIYWTLMMFFAELMDCCTMRLEQHVVVMQLWQTQVSGAPVCSPKRAFRVYWTRLKRLFKCMTVSWNFPRFSKTFRSQKVHEFNEVLYGKDEVIHGKDEILHRKDEALWIRWVPHVRDSLSRSKFEKILQF